MNLSAEGRVTFPLGDASKLATLFFLFALILDFLVFLSGIFLSWSTAGQTTRSRVKRKTKQPKMHFLLWPLEADSSSEL